MKIYIAAPYPWRERALAVAEVLESKGHEVTARWIREEEDDVSKFGSYADKDITDIESAQDVVVMTGYSGFRSHTGGRHWETGYAWAKGKGIWVLGPRENVFHHLEGVTQIDTAEEFPNA